MTFRFLARSSAGQVIIGGLLELPAGTSIEQATKRAAHEAARIAYIMDIEWNPFEPTIAIRIIKPPPKRRRPKSHAPHQ
jgi:hypothetical protein